MSLRDRLYEECFEYKEREMTAEEAIRDSKKVQVGGNHYQLPIQPITYILENKLGYCEGNVIKYITRHNSKNGAEDIKKAIHYCKFILENKYGEKL